MTEILLEVTTEEISSAAADAFQRVHGKSLTFSFFFLYRYTSLDRDLKSQAGQFGTLFWNCKS